MSACRLRCPSVRFLRLGGSFVLPLVLALLPPRLLAQVEVALPVLASGADARRGPGKLIGEASGVHARPLQPLPPPSGVRRVPQVAGPTGGRA